MSNISGNRNETGKYWIPTKFERKFKNKKNLEKNRNRENLKETSKPGKSLNKRENK